jgi:lactate racemase
VSDCYLIGQGKREIGFRLPDSWHILKNAVFAAVEEQVDIPRLVGEALANPVGTPPLAELLKGKKSIVIVVDDLTRPTPRKALLASLVGFLHEQGVADDQIDVVIGLGTHRPVTQAEIEETFGEALCSSLRITNHDCRAADLVAVGSLPHSGEVLINSTFMRADLRIALGSILPHPWNGFGGGAKLVLPGVAGWDTIKRHHLALVTAKGTWLGNLTNNPFHDEVYQAGRMARLDFIVNAVYNSNEDVKGIVAGDFEEAYRVGAELCTKELGIEFEQAADVTIASVFPYCDGPQTMKPLNPATMVTKKGGTVILYVEELLGGCYPASMLEAFGKALSLANGDPRGLVFDYLGRGELIAPEAPMDVNSAINTTLLFLSRVRVILVSKDADAQQAARLGFDYAASLDEAIARVSTEIPQATVNVLPAGGLVFPLLAEAMKFEY